ncbi:FAD-dependent monooxygenase [Henriciella aquimarina]|uniref:FAD-dependent monooxygenase n=1 Tax=Henriciella aquimarina TaxID=545261 RepID=UPI0009FE2043|nr:FAD-dependent monooxygenase [Henriciella aquimarina]
MARETSKHQNSGMALVAGGGIGGLTAALCLLQRGWSVHVLEAADALEEVGAGLQLSPNAMHVLDALGLGDAIRAAAFEPEALELRLGRSGQRVFSIPAGPAARKRWGADYLHMHRADLLKVLANAVRANPAAGISLGARVTGYKNTESGPQIMLASGEPLAADLVIGADGIHSTLRTQMLGPDSPRFTGNLAWRVVVPMERLKHPPPPTACVWAGRGRHAVTYRLRGGTLANLVGVIERQDWQGESWTEQGTKQQALADFAGWPLPVTELINQADAHYRWALFDRAPLACWHDGAVALLGDACHPMLPFMAQGAAMGIEDAWVMAREVTQAETVEAGLARYEAIRKPRTSRVQAASRGNMKTFHRKSPLGQLATYGPMWLGGQFLPGVVRAHQDWIYGHNVTATDR